MNIPGKIVGFTGKKPANDQNKPIHEGILCEIDKIKIRREKDFVQKAGVAVFLVKIAKKC